MRNKNKKNTTNKYDISFVSTVPGLEKIEDCLPKPVSKYIPDWWKEMPTKQNVVDLDGFHKTGQPTAGNAKICPSFADYFSKGYIMPMWTDTIIYYDSKSDAYEWRTSDSQFVWSQHHNDQYLKNVNHKFFGKKSYFVFKIECPWKVISEEKFLMYQLPTYFHFNDDYSVVPGVRDISVYPVMNIQFLIHSDKKEIFIERGTPIAHFIPFKKEDISIDVRAANENDKKIIEKFQINSRTKFFSTYRKDKKQ
jgi:hypothetical protein